MPGKAIDLQAVADEIRTKKRRAIDFTEVAKVSHSRMDALARGETVSIQKDQKGKTSPGRSTGADGDPVSSFLESGQIIDPPFDMLTLAMLPEQSSELNQCLDAMVTNIEGFGHRFVPRLKLKADDENQALKAEVHAEHVRLQNFFQYVDIDDDFTTLRKKKRRDEEATGNAYFEVIRDVNGMVQGLNHVPSHQVKIGKAEEEMREVEVPILELQPDNSVKVAKVKRWKRHRKYLQSRTVRRRNMVVLSGAKLTWFKDFQDPRAIDNKSGEIITDVEKIKELQSKHQLANEILHFKLYSPRSVYGLPRFVGNLLSIFGDRAAEEINFITFRNNNIPSMAISVSNGQLTEGTIRRIESFVESQIQGSDNYSKFLIIEAETFIEGEDGGHLKIDIKPLTKDQHKDAMFQKYSSNNRDSIRRAFRLPPILVGRAEDYTRATADSSIKLADEQIFAPERDTFDAFMNRRLFPEMGIKYHKYKSNSPNTTDNTELVKILSGAEKTGGMTPRIARAILGDVLGMILPDVDETTNPDVPFSLTMAEAVKNQADPSEPGQQVTALKAISMLTGSDEHDMDDQVAQATASILTVRDAVEKKLRNAAEQAEDSWIEDLKMD